jgi:hypothetical protein
LYYEVLVEPDILVGSEKPLEGGFIVMGMVRATAIDVDDGVMAGAAETHPY